MAGPAAMVRGAPTSKILKQIWRLNNIAGTPKTAFRFPQTVSKLELVLLQKHVWGPPLGLKHFWRNNLPTLKFHNEDLRMAVTRVKVASKAEIAEAPTKIVVHYTDGTKKDLDCAKKKPERILRDLVKLTSATSVPESDIPLVKAPEDHF